MNALLPFATLPTPEVRGPEIIIDSFAGGGGASTGIFMALGRHPDVAINHDPEAIAMHTANHPETAHYCQSVMAVDPREVAGGRPVGLLWASPDCKHFSKAKGGRPLSKGIRDLAWVVVHYAELVRPRVIILENVEEFQTWGPLDAEGYPIGDRKGETFQAWVKALRRLGYRVEWQERRACNAGAPTIRKRLYVIARRDGRPIVWPAPTHGAPTSPEVLSGALPAWRTAADVIDWSIPCPSIFNRARPLKDATMRRIARGVVRYVIEDAQPFLVPVTHSGDLRCWPASEPLRTITGAKRGEFALVSAFLAKHYGGTYQGAGAPMDGPLHTITTTDHHALVAASMLNLRGSERGGRSCAEPLATVTAKGTHAGVVAAFLTKYYGTGGQHQGCAEPLHTIPTIARFGLVTVTIQGEPYVITDIGMRMLSPRELFRAQGFPDDYIIDVLHAGKPLSKASQISKCGNSVSPYEARDLVAGNVPELAVAAPAEAA